ncbi:hypothetical protein Hanom_Chr16g01469391 [Helianthus anomalus]
MKSWNIVQLFDEDWLKDHLGDIDENLKDRDSTEDATDSFKEWRKLFVSKVAKPTIPEAQVDYMKFEKSTSTGRYKLVYQLVRVMDKIPLMPMKQNFLENMALWCYDSNTHEVVIVFKDDQENFRMLDPMWMVNMSAADINKLFRHDIFYEDKDAPQALQFQRVACFCFYRGIHAGSTWSAQH